MSIKFSAISNRGKVRKENQDRIYISGIDQRDADQINRKGTLEAAPVTFAIFDGMGGELCGKTAAKIAADTVQKHENMEPTLLCRTINQNICSFMDQQHISSMGSTAAIMQVSHNAVYCCNLGDSRAYYVSGGEMLQISVDHTVTLGKKRVLTQYLGIPETEVVIEPSIRKVALKKNDKLLLCSDGLTDMVSREEIAEIVNQNQTEEAATALFEAAMAHGGKDNISIIVCEVA